MKQDSPHAHDDAFARARTGDRAAFATLVRRHQRPVFSIALRMLNDPHKAEDLAQEVFLQLHRKLLSIESDAHLSFWLRRVATNRAIDRLRSERAHDTEPLDEASDTAAESVDDDPLLQRRLAGLIAELAPSARAVVLLRYQEDLDPAEIARTLDMSINTVKSHLKRSLATLRARVLKVRLTELPKHESP